MKKLKLFGTRLITSTYPRTPNVVTLKEGDKISDINFVEGDLLDADSVKIMAAQAAIDIEAIITYSELKALRDAGELVPGQQYRITDYVTTTTQDSTQSAGHAFDVIVTADSADKLNESARAIQHAGDTYFANSKLSAWKLKYCLDNDTNRFAWADATNGKGVIYWMKDEFNNECPYDFKNIQYVFSQEGFNIHVSSGPGYNTFFYRDSSLDENNYYGWKTDYSQYGGPSKLYTDTLALSTSMQLYNDTTGTITRHQILSVIADVFNTFTFDKNGTEASITGQTTEVYNNIMRAYYNHGIQQLNVIYFRSTSSTSVQAYNNVFGNYCSGNSFGINCHGNSFGNSCYNNSFGNSCYNNSFGNYCNGNSFGTNCTYNTFGNYCYKNSFGSNCTYNTFGHICHDNAFGSYCDYNTFSEACYYNTFESSCTHNTFWSNCENNSFGSSCTHNTFWSNCDYNTFKSLCSYNTFGSVCNRNTFETYCDYNTFGVNCSYNTFGQDCSYNDIVSNCNYIVFEKKYTQHVIVEGANKYITLTSTKTTSGSNRLQNIKIAQGVNNTSTVKTISHDTVEDTFQTIYQPTNSQTISV